MATAVGKRRMRSISAGWCWNWAADGFGSRLGDGPSCQDRFERFAQVMLRHDGPPLSQSSILVVDPPAIEEFASGGKNGGLWSNRRAGPVGPVVIWVESNRHWNLKIARVLPRFLGRLHPRYRTPHAAIILIGLLSCLAPLFGRNALVWFVNAGSFGAVIAYLLVAISFVRLRYSEPHMPRPFRLTHGLTLGWIGVVCCVALGLIYLPGSPSALAPVEWVIVFAFAAAGFGFHLWSRIE